MTKKFDKLFTALKYYLIGKDFNTALKALQFARQYHSGKRKDGITPEFQHQLEICHYLITLKNLEDEESVISAALLHDVMEDYDIPVETMNKEFGKKLTNIVLTLSKKYKGKKIPLDQYFDNISKCPIASIVKGGDRTHNLQSMIGVFSKEKQKSYMKDVEDYFLPMIKKASYNFPNQTSAYFNIKHLLKSQLELIGASLK